jgi:glutamate decarboxylase
VQQACQDVAMYLSREIAATGKFELLTDGSDLPVFAFRLRDPGAVNYTVFDLSERLRQRGWLVPAYTFPQDLQDTAVLRIVVRNGFSMDLARLLLDDLRVQVHMLASQPHPPTPLIPGPIKNREGFAH